MNELAAAARAAGPRERTIAHVDMDAFFVACELLRRPELRGRPVIVGNGNGAKSRGVVMTASYEARQFGVHSALPLAIAYRRCPQAVLIPTDMAFYRRGSAKVHEVFRRFTELVEAAGLDEAYLDLSSSPAPKTRARQLKAEVLAETGLVASIGLAPNKLLAKIASDLDKPDGFYVLEPEGMLEAVGDRPASLIPGIGPKTAERLTGAGIKTIADLAGTPVESLTSLLGPSAGSRLHEMAHGRDERPVTVGRVRKSESRETTFAEDVDDDETLRETLSSLVEGVCASLAEHRLEGRTVTLKIRLRPFRTHTRSKTLEGPTADPGLVGRVASALLEGFERDAPVRLIGVGLAGLRGAGDAPPERPGDPLSLQLAV